ncbi:succinylglutamate desuccinylase/aspartoacylase family protein [Maribacter sp. 2307ULW6-5]|uniref:succinylglutamate desuccinylase/aspartoacylase family protein n=1 Tax=Maribacter sp. 2307ULW6-5 TaxID=3386275 RepID=UPI0039BC9135
MFDVRENKTILVNGQAVAPGKHKSLSIPIDRLPTGTLIDIPVYVFNSKKPGPVLLVQAGLHGDEINGIEIVRRMLQQKEFYPEAGAVIAVPVLNVFGFIHFSREVPDGKDVNRSFPGNKRGSLASRIAGRYLNEVVRQADVAIDLHTGGAQRHNYPQARYTENDAQSKALAAAFKAPLAFPSKLIKGSFRNAAHKLGIPTVVYEAGESMRFNTFAIAQGVSGIKNVMHYLNMTTGAAGSQGKPDTMYLLKRKWLRAPTAGMFMPVIENGQAVKKGEVLGQVSDTYALRTKEIRAPFDGIVICINQTAVVNQGDAIFHLGSP